MSKGWYCLYVLYLYCVSVFNKLHSRFQIAASREIQCSHLVQLSFINGCVFYLLVLFCLVWCGVKGSNEIAFLIECQRELKQKKKEKKKRFSMARLREREREKERWRENRITWKELCFMLGEWNKMSQRTTPLVISLLFKNMKRILGSSIQNLQNLQSRI